MSEMLSIFLPEDSDRRLKIWDVCTKSVVVMEKEWIVVAYEHTSDDEDEYTILNIYELDDNGNPYVLL